MNHERHEKHEEKMAVPKLRFPEFRGMGEWSTREFGALIELIEERAGTKKYTLMSVTAGVGLVSQLEKFGREIAGNAYKNYYVIKKGDFAYNKSATKLFPEGYIAMLTEHDKAALPNSIFICFRIVDKNTYSKIFDHLFHANYHGSWLRKFIAVGARAHGSLNVDTKHLLDMPVVLPTLHEQQKIANCLTSLDELITAEAGKLEAYKAHKKGLMQKLFPAEGETVPEWRFPEFRDSGEWEEKSLIEVCEKISQGGTPDTSNLVYWNGLIEWLTPAEMGKLETRFVHSTVRKITELGLKNCSSDLLPINSVILSTRAPIGHLAINKIEMTMNQGCKALIPNRVTNYDFLFYCLAFHKKQLSDLGAGNTFKELSANSLKNYKIVIPYLSEQQKIADCLSSLDELITAQAQKIDTLKTHKKGLMQGLFPSAEENI